MHWLAAVEQLRTARVPGVLITLVSVRGHAPRDAGAKMVASPDRTWGSIGGGNLEATAVDHARAMLARGDGIPEQLGLSLNDRALVTHGQQCCGGEVSVLLEPLAVVPSVAIFGQGHVGTELARILVRHDLELHLVDGRADRLGGDLLTVLDDTVARVHTHHSPVPELVLGQVPPGTHVLIMTHDHAEDAALCDAALRCSHLGSIGLIGSSAKWRRFEKRLAAEGHSARDVRRIKSPIGVPEVVGKSPATIAVAVAADLLAAFERERAAQDRPRDPVPGDRPGHTDHPLRP